MSVCVWFFLLGEELDDLVLQSYGGGKCIEDPTKNYSVVVEFDCKKFMKVGNSKVGVPGKSFEFLFWEIQICSKVQINPILSLTIVWPVNKSDCVIRSVATLKSTNAV